MKMENIVGVNVQILIKISKIWAPLPWKDLSANNKHFRKGKVFGRSYLTEMMSWFYMSNISKYSIYLKLERVKISGA